MAPSSAPSVTAAPRRQTMRCQQELNTIKSPDVEYEERATFIKSCIDECWDRYDHRSLSNQSKMREEIINYGRELERLSFRREVGLAEATAAYNRRLDEVWTTYAVEFITVLQSSLPEQTIRSLCESFVRIYALGHSALRNRLATVDASAEERLPVTVRQHYGHLGSTPRSAQRVDDCIARDLSMECLPKAAPGPWHGRKLRIPQLATTLQLGLSGFDPSVVVEEQTNLSGQKKLPLLMISKTTCRKIPIQAVQRSSITQEQYDDSRSSILSRFASV
ncbi:hypothetical protein Purlil1_13044 [Purpureocillium lilacinum]|uniref:Uncharacterized protein n=1 Tax=Purpureocillium lilacinum TaxID=33203 RepID=A0ABR0BFD6_PURLI|nr:hypothetical protein Purlil1_13044 [Purpureocillium lilacinum]